MPPVQCYPLYNGSNQIVKFQIDTSSLDLIQQVNTYRTTDKEWSYEKEKGVELQNF